MKIVQSGNPVGEVVSLDLLRKQTRNADDTGVFNNDDDAILQQYLDAAVEWVQGVPGTITDYEIVDNRLVIENAPRVQSATVVFTAGIGAGNVPVKLVQASLMLAEHFYDKSGEEVPAAVKAMTAHHRSFAY